VPVEVVYSKLHRKIFHHDDSQRAFSGAGFSLTETLNLFCGGAYGVDDARPCPCGSGLSSHWVNDARGIPLCRICLTCAKDKLSGYRPEVLTDSNYYADEDIDGD